MSKLVTVYQSTWHNTPEDLIPYQHYCENLEAQKLLVRQKAGPLTSQVILGP